MTFPQLICMDSADTKTDTKMAPQDNVLPSSQGAFTIDNLRAS